MIWYLKLSPYAHYFAGVFELTYFLYIYQFILNLYGWLFKSYICPEAYSRITASFTSVRQVKSSFYKHQAYLPCDYSGFKHKKFDLHVIWGILILWSFKSKWDFAYKIIKIHAVKHVSYIFLIIRTVHIINDC